MTFDMSSWNTKGCISRNWKHILSGRTFTWALAESPQAEQSGKLQASVWLEAKRIWFYHWACCVNMWACLYLPLCFLCCNLFSFLRCFLCLFWKMKTPVPLARSQTPLLHHPLCESHRVFLCVGKISWDDRYMYSIFTLNLKPKPKLAWSFDQDHYSLRVTFQIILGAATDALSAVWHYRERSHVPGTGYCKKWLGCLKKGKW